MPHPLLPILLEAARGRPPQPDGQVEVLPPMSGPVDAMVTFTGHSYLVADIDLELARPQLRPDDPGAASLPTFLHWLAAQLGTRAGQLDIVLAASGLSGAPAAQLEPRTDLDHHPRVVRARRYRSELQVFASPGAGGVLTLGRGLAGRWEAAFEVEPEQRGRGLGRALVLAARHLVSPEEPVFVQVAPGNAASLRAVLAAGYRPLGGEVLFPRTPDRRCAVSIRS